MSDYRYKNHRFVIDNYLNKSPFSNFLPGVAGKMGIPLWAFYVNRGQGICGFGLENKSRPIMEFFPANKAYQAVGQVGFRTFLKVNHHYYEPFRPNSKQHNHLAIERAAFSIEEVNEDLGVKISVTYFGLPNEAIGALVRKVTIENIGKCTIDVEGLDGLTELLPSGISNADFKAVSNLLVSWMDVEELANHFAFYKLRSSTGDSSEVKTAKDGNFLVGYVDKQVTTPIVDQDLIFGQDNLKLTAAYFDKHHISDICRQKQVTVNKIPAGFLPFAKKLKEGEHITIETMIGHTYSRDFLVKFIDQIDQDTYFEEKLNEAKAVIDEMVADVETDTAYDIFDDFIKQSYLDNFLRGGYPYAIGDSVYHLYSRRHGDLERDYNFFSLAPEFYSQGGGNFRDVCQNRRLDSFIHRDVKAHNIKHFASLIQLDGYNPLTVNGLYFIIDDETLCQQLVETHFIDANKELIPFLNRSFTPGGLVNYVFREGIIAKTEATVYLNAIISQARIIYESAFGEGYWSDHFTYLLDIIESYEAIYPDQMDKLLYHDKDILSFESPVTVLPRTEKAVLTKDGKIRQYGSLLHFDKDKISTLNLNVNGSNWVQFRRRDYKTNLFTKLLILVLNKHSQLDMDGLGIEMEAEKPGWNDAMNGLPGLFGSGVSETIELKRIVDFLLKHVGSYDVSVPVEIDSLFQHLLQASTYEARLVAREQYRESIRFGLGGNVNYITPAQIKQYLKATSQQLQTALDQLYDEDPIIPTYIVHEVKDYVPIEDQGQPVIGNYQMPLVKPLTYKKRYLPRFLEAPARLLKAGFDQDKLKIMVEKIRTSDIYDTKLRIYKTSEKLENEDYEIGRIRAFTEGWLERESDFLHMIYKYLVGLLKAGLYKDYYQEIQTNLVCFMNPEVYGRSILENSSFIAPSNNPNPHIHGKGFLPRLTGSTIEVLDMWRVMMLGNKPFQLKEGHLIFKPEPKLHRSFFKKDGTVSFRFMKDIDITIHNPKHYNTFDDGEIYKIELDHEGVKETIYQAYVEKNQALKIRDGFYRKIEIYIK